MRVKNAKFLVYPEYNAEFLDWVRDYKYLGVFHNMDNSVPHYHYVVMFPSQMEIDTISSRSGLDPRFIRNCPDVDIFKRYLIHLDNPEKYQYKPSDVFGSIPYEFSLDDSFDTRLSILDSVRGYPSYRKVLRRFIQNKQFYLFQKFHYRLIPVITELQREHNRIFNKE